MNNSVRSVILAVPAFILTAAMFVACDSDSGTSANSGETSSSSVSEVILSSSQNQQSSSSVDSDDPKSDESSSSVKASSSSHSELDSESTSSSSVSEVILSSSQNQQSSSSVDPESPQGDESSSSIDAKGDESSSSEYVTFDHKNFLASELTISKDRYSQFTDERNGRSYYYITITGKDTSGKANSVTVMAENLNIGDMIYGWEDQMDDTKIERYCYDDDTTYCDKYGGLYQWAEMMALPNKCNTESCADSIKPNHQGICPEGWRLLTYNDIYTIVHADGNDDGLKGVRSEYQFGGFNTTGYSLVGAGYNWDYGFTNVKESTYWYYPEEKTALRAFVSSMSKSSTILGTPINTDKTHGFSVRCAMVENP